MAVRHFRRRPAPRRRGGRANSVVNGPWGAVVSALAGVILAVVCVSWLNSRMSPTLLKLAEAQVSREVTALVTARVEETLFEEGVGYGDMVTIEKDAAGQIAALTTNTAALNALRTQVLGGVTEDLEELSRESIPIPAGNLTGWDLLSGVGPNIRVGLVTAGTASGEFRSEFSSAGVNQTRHRLDLEVAVEVSILLPSGSVERTVTARVPVAETVIVGQTPQQFFSMGTGGT